MDSIADLGWEGGEKTDQWDYLKGERYDGELLRQIAGGRESVALRESQEGVSIVGVLD